jgi:hydrogenase maturation protease
VLEAEVPDLETWPAEQRAGFLADTHYTTPSKALLLAKALGVLPDQVYIVGCQPAEVAELGIGLSELVEHAATEATRRVERLVHQLLSATS